MGQSVSTPPLNLAVFISGRGSNLQALIDACSNPEFPARIALVLSNTPDAAGLERAQEADIQTAVVRHQDFESRESFETTLLETLTPYNIDLICLAGFMRILTPHFIDHWPQKMINIHPSLLPDYKGLKTHERVLEDGQQETGCTVHYVSPELDSGPTILQRRVSVETGDTPNSLAARVLEQEHLAYPEAIQLIAAARK